MFEEVKEMIDSTVYTNGNGEVTAQNINLAMQGIVEATEEKIEAVETNVADVTNRVAELEQNGGSGNAGGSGALKVWAEDAEAGMFLTEEQKAENVATYNVLIKGEQVPVILCSKYEMSDEGFSASQTTTYSVSYAAFKYSSSGENREDVMFFLGDNMESVFILHSDGTIELPEEPSTPASSGPLRVWINEANTPEQIDENAATYNAIKNNNAQNVIAVTALNEDGTTMTRIFNVLNMVVLSGNLNDVVLTFAREWEDGKASLASITLYEDGTFELE